MWCYQIPHFEAHVISKLQEQQRCSQFCDTLLKAEGVSVPAHSWILSAISPCVSFAFASTAPPPAGFTQLLELGAFGARSLLHVVQLLYSGQMMGEGEKEKQEAFSAAARLGIHGLVEVTRTDRKQKNQQEVREVGLQTESEETRQYEMALGVGLDMWTQTEEIEENQAPPPLPQLEVSYQTLDVSALQMETYEDSSHMMPLSFIYPPDENQPAQPLSHWSPSEFTASQPNTSLPSIPQPRKIGLDAGLAIISLPVTAEEHDNHLKQFNGNIPGFISDFLNLNRECGPCAKMPQDGKQQEMAKMKLQRGRRQGLLTQIVDVQQVWVVSRKHKLFMHRPGGRWCPQGQGGGTVGRRMHLKTRALLNNTSRQHRTRVCSKVWEVSPNGDLRLRRRCISTSQLTKQDNLPAFLGKRSNAKSTLTTSITIQPVQNCDAEAPPLSGPILQSSPSALQYPTTLSSDQPQCMNHLLEKITMGQGIQPDTHHLPSATGTVSSISSVGNVASDHLQGNNVSLQRSTEAVNGLNRCAGSNPDHEQDVALQQECEGEMNQILETFLQSFEPHVDCDRQERDAGSVGSIFSSIFDSSLTTPLPPVPQRDEKQQSSSLPHPEHNHTPARSLTKRGTHNSQLLEKIMKNRNIRVNKDYLLWNPVVKVDRIKEIPVTTSRRGLYSPNPKEKNSERITTASFTAMTSRTPVSAYPIRTRRRASHELGGGASERKQLKAGCSPTAGGQQHQVGVHRNNRKGHVENNGSDVQTVDGQSNSMEKSEVAPKQAKKRGRKRKKCGKKRKSDSKDDVSAKKVYFDQRWSSAEAIAVESNIRIEQSMDKKSYQVEEVRHTDTDTLPESVSASADIKTQPELMVESAGNDDIDVVTAASPAPNPVIIHWSEASAGEEEEEGIDVIG